jgi:hypothetical protein
MSRLAVWWQHIAHSAGGRALVIAVVAICLTLPAAHPAMFGALQQSDDGLLHLYRLVALDSSIRQGDLWPRYSPGMAYGYGIPTFNYYSPLSLYPMEALHLVFGLRFVDAFLLGMILYTILGAAGAYLLGESWGGPLAGLIASAAYAYAPYTLINWPRRGAVAEFLALALLVWALWAFRRLSLHGRRRDFVLAAGLFTLIILTHNIMALLGAALLAAYSVLLWWTSPDPPRTFWRLALALLLPLGLAAFYWMPALFELRYVQIERAATGIGAAAGSQYFQTLSDIFALPHSADLTQMQVRAEHPLGWPQAALALAAVGLIVWRGVRGSGAGHHPLRHWLIFAGPLLLALILMQTPASAWLWNALPLLHFVQFPWRLMGAASLLLAVLAGAGAALIAPYIARPVPRALFVGAALAAIVIPALPWLYGVYVPDSPGASIVDVQNFERRTSLIGGTAAGEYLPRWTTVMPDPDRLLGLYAQSEVIPRLQPVAGVTVQEAQWGPKSAWLELEAAAPTRLVFDWLYFPGWWARVDGKQAAIIPTRPHGFISVEAPAGEHTLELGFSPTPLRLAATIISGVALAALGVALGLRRLWRGASAPESGPGWPEAGPLFVAAALVGLVIFGGKALLIDNIQSAIKRERFAAGVEAGLQTPVLATIGGQVTLLGFDLPRAQVRSGGSLPITLYWSLAGGPIVEDLSPVIMLRDEEGNVLQQQLDFYPAGVPTSTWIPGFYVAEPLSVQIPAGTPPGTYLVQAGLYSESAGRTLDVLNVAGSPVGVLADLAPVEVTRPARPARTARLPIDEPLNMRLSRALTLVSIAPLPERAEVGEQLSVVWYWRAARRPGADFSARLVWLDSGGETAARTPAVPPAAGYPTSVWKRGDVWRGLHLLYVPGSLEAGDYEVAVQLYDAAGEPAGDPAVIGEMAVSTPPRSFDVPEMDVLAGAGWENGIQLLGYDLPNRHLRRGDGLSLTLYWQPRDEITTSLTVFVHLIDVENTIVAQRDQLPAAGSRPTAGWAPGEVIADGYGFLISEEIPPGEYRLRVGWYDARTGDRVRLADGSDFWLLPQVITVR